METIVTVIIIAVTALISIAAFQNEELVRRTIFNPYAVYHKKQVHRLLTHGFLHANWAHLIFNMLTFFFFAPWVLGNLGSVWLFVVFYLSAIIIASLTTLFRHKNDSGYNSLGASGGVSAVLFAFIMYEPLSTIHFYFAIPIPAILYAVIYLIYSQYMSKRGGDGINHDAHFLGAVYGIIFPVLVEPRVVISFYQQIVDGISKLL